MSKAITQKSPRKPAGRRKARSMNRKLMVKSTWLVELRNSVSLVSRFQKWRASHSVNWEPSVEPTGGR